MVALNERWLVKLSVLGEVVNPVMRDLPYRVTPDGEPLILPGVGGITYNVRVGDPAVGWAGDHVEPGVSIKHGGAKGEPKPANTALNVLSCIGNEAVVVSGEAKGAKGVVVGKHGGVEHVLVDFEPSILERLCIGDKVLVKAYGQGLKILDAPGIRVMNADPILIKAMELKLEDGKLAVPVTHVIPAAIMGSGLGAMHCYSGDYDIQLFDKRIVEEYHLGDLRLGDLVAIVDADHSYGRVYLTGAVSVGVVVHTNCVTSGHGPGVVTVMTSKSGAIKPVIDPKANIAVLLGIRSEI